MSVRQPRPWLAVPLVLALAALACGGGVEPSATPFPPPASRTPRATATPQEEPTEAPAPTRTPRATATEAASVTLELSDTSYDHPSGAFSIFFPDGWEVAEDDVRTDGVFVTSPDGAAAIDVSFTNVGLSFDDEVLDSYVTAIETNWFGTFAEYLEAAREPQPDGSLLVLKTLELSDGAPQTVFTYYWQEGTVMFHQDFWVDSGSYEAYADGLVAVANSMQTDAEAGAASPLYEFRYTFTGPNDLFEFRVPYGWHYATESNDTTTIDTFTSPDRWSLVENITYDDGQPVSKTEASRFALAMLKDVYDIEDIRVSDDQVQPDGSERLTWSSQSKGYDGVSFFETRGTTFLLLTWIVDQDHTELYLPVWLDLVDTYNVPE